MNLVNQDLLLIKEILTIPNIEIDVLSNKLGLTRRQVDYSIRKINGISKDHGRISNSNGHISMDTKTRDYLMDILEKRYEIVHILNEEERGIILLLKLILKEKDEDISLYDLSDLLGVSKNTIITDIRNSSDLAHRFDLEVNYSRIAGYELVGSEYNIRKLIYNISNRLSNIYSNEEYLQLITNYSLQEMKKEISQVEEYLHVHFTDEGYKMLSINLFINLHRINNKNILSTSIGYKTGNLTNLFKKMYQELEIYPNDLSWLEILIFSTPTIDQGLNIEKEDDLYAAIHDFLELLIQKSVFSIDITDEFINQIAVHIKPAIYRIYLGLPIENVPLNYGNENYEYLYNVVKKSIKPLEDFIQHSIPGEEIFYLTLYIGSKLLKQGVNIVNHKKALLVCTSGMATSKMLFYTLKGIFPNFTFLESVSKRQYEMNDYDYDLVFTTVALQSDKPVFLVNPIMTSEDKQYLYNYVSTKLNIKERYPYTFDDIIRVIESYCEINDRPMLMDELREILVHSEDILPSNLDYQKELSSFFLPGSIQIVDELLTLNEAIEKSCEQLLENGLIHYSYVEELQTLMHETPEPFLIGNNIILPHIESDAVMYDGFGFLVLRKPIKVTNQEINFILPLAITKNNNPFKAINQLFRILENKEVMEEIKEQVCSNGIYNIIQREEKM